MRISNYFWYKLKVAVIGKRIEVAVELIVYFKRCSSYSYRYSGGVYIMHSGSLLTRLKYGRLKSGTAAFQSKQQKKFLCTFPIKCMSILENYI